MSKNTKAVVRRRVEEVLGLRCLGAEFTDIVQYAAQNDWGVKERQLWNYIRAGDKILAETLEKDREKLINRHIAQRRALYSRAMSVSDYGTALRVLSDEAKLLDLYPAAKTQLSGPDGGPIPMELTHAERDAAIVGILARVGAAGGGPADSGAADGDGRPLDPARGPDGPGEHDAGPLASGPAPLF